LGLGLDYLIGRSRSVVGLGLHCHAAGQARDLREEFPNPHTTTLPRRDESSRLEPIRRAAVWLGRVDEVSLMA
jgi:hypothetical protein